MNTLRPKFKMWAQIEEGFRPFVCPDECYDKDLGLLTGRRTGAVMYHSVIGKRLVTSLMSETGPPIQCAIFSTMCMFLCFSAVPGCYRMSITLLSIRQLQSRKSNSHCNFRQIA